MMERRTEEFIKCHVRYALINHAIQFTGSIQNTTTHMVRLSFLTLLSLCLLATMLHCRTEVYKHNSITIYAYHVA